MKKRQGLKGFAVLFFVVDAATVDVYVDVDVVGGARHSANIS